MTSTWISPPTRTELIENLVSGVGMFFLIFPAEVSTRRKKIDRPLQPFQRLDSRRLPVLPDQKRGLRLFGKPGHP